MLTPVTVQFACPTVFHNGRVPEGDNLIRLEFRYHTPHSVMVGKAIRAVSGIRAALVLADLGYVTECGALLRIASDICSEVIAIGHALDRGGELRPAAQKFVEHYFAPKARTPEQLAASERVRYVSREELMKAGRQQMRISMGSTCGLPIDF